MSAAPHPAAAPCITPLNGTSTHDARLHHTTPCWQPAITRPAQRCVGSTGRPRALTVEGLADLGSWDCSGGALYLVIRGRPKTFSARLPPTISLSSVRSSSASSASATSMTLSSCSARWCIKTIPATPAGIVPSVIRGAPERPTGGANEISSRAAASGEAYEERCQRPQRRMTLSRA